MPNAFATTNEVAKWVPNSITDGFSYGDNESSFATTNEVANWVANSITDGFSYEL